MEEKEVKIRGMEIGNGMPKICVPIVEKNRENILLQAQLISKESPDIVEFRADWYEDMENWEKMEGLLRELRQTIGNIALLFTVRTQCEGGNAEISGEDYRCLCERVCQSGYIDLIDIEAYKEANLLQQICKSAHENGVYVVASNHDFDKTPSEEEIVERLCFMDQNGADIPKIAVMPQSESDVLTLLCATQKYKIMGGIKPVITMSMSGKGVISRLAGEIFGSAVTFASIGKSSAPGQIPIDEVRRVLEVIHRYC
ncbi:MAG: type I 3-dehydroquinate dehydratase [Lachnospiraceae bacterium]|nr:type I 3-dehydroquinate dehydratase [Lachnospiraceae bacterium]